MKILIVTNFYPPFALGGYERLCESVANGLRERGHDVHVLTSQYRRGESSMREPGVTRELRLLTNEMNIYQPHQYSTAEVESINAENLTVLGDTLDAFGPDVTFVWNLFFLDLSILTAFDSGTRPVAYFLTDNWLANALNPAFVSQYFRDVVFGEREHVGSQSDAIRLSGTAIFGSNYMEQFYTQAGLTFSQTCVVHNGVLAPSMREADRSPLTRLLPRRAGEWRLLCAGRIVDLKDPETAIRAIAIVRAKRPSLDIRLDIVGDSADKAYLGHLHTLVASLGLTDRLQFLPPVNEHSLRDLFDTADCYLFPSIYEPFALTLIHAMLAGMPVIATAVGGNLEIVEQGRSGLLFPKRDASALAERILTVYDDPVARVSISRGGMAAAMRFSFDRMVEEVDKKLAELSNTNCDLPL